MPVQVDGEPWVQSPGDVVVLKSALKVKNYLIIINNQYLNGPVKLEAKCIDGKSLSFLSFSFSLFSISLF